MRYSHSAGVSFPRGPDEVWTASTSIGMMSVSVGRVAVVGWVGRSEEGLPGFLPDSSHFSISCWWMLASTWILMFSHPCSVWGQLMILTRLTLMAGLRPFMKHEIFVCSVMSRWDKISMKRVRYKWVELVWTSWTSLCSVVWIKRGSENFFLNSSMNLDQLWSRGEPVFSKWLNHSTGIPSWHQEKPKLLICENKWGLTVTKLFSTYFTDSAPISLQLVVNQQSHTYSALIPSGYVEIRKDWPKVYLWASIYIVFTASVVTVGILIKLTLLGNIWKFEDNVYESGTHAVGWWAWEASKMSTTWGPLALA